MACALFTYQSSHRLARFFPASDATKRFPTVAIGTVVPQLTAVASATPRRSPDTVADDHAQSAHPGAIYGSLRALGPLLDISHKIPGWPVPTQIENDSVIARRLAERCARWIPILARPARILQHSPQTLSTSVIHRS